MVSDYSTEPLKSDTAGINGNNLKLFGMQIPHFIAEKLF